MTKKVSEKTFNFYKKMWEQDNSPLSFPEYLITLVDDHSNTISLLRDELELCKGKNNALKRLADQDEKNIKNLLYVSENKMKY